MTYKLLALNIDGTIVRSNDRITKQTKDAIEYVKSKGVYVTLVTSRSFPSAKKIAKALKVDGYLITSDGSFVARSANDSLFVRRIKEERALQIVDVLERYECHIQIMNDSYCLANKVKQKNHLIAKMTIGIGEQIFNPVTFVDSVSEKLMEKPLAPHKINAQFFTEAEKEKAMTQLRKVVSGIQIIETGSNSVDMISVGVSKAKGLQKLGDRLGISSNEMVAIGVNDQDKDMITQVGLGVAMGNATRSVREVADWVTRTNEQDGVSYMIKEVFRKQLKLQL